MKVYGWQGRRIKCSPAENGSRQTREIVAAKSMAEVGRIVGEDPRRLFNLGTTENEAELEVALSDPGVVYWRPIYSRGSDAYRKSNP